jgi:hypothetical protein
MKIGKTGKFTGKVTAEERGCLKRPIVILSEAQNLSFMNYL